MRATSRFRAECSKKQPHRGQTRASTEWAVSEFPFHAQVQRDSGICYCWLRISCRRANSASADLRLSESAFVPRSLCQILADFRGLAYERISLVAALPALVCSRSRPVGLSPISRRWWPALRRSVFAQACQWRFAAGRQTAPRYFAHRLFYLSNEVGFDRRASIRAQQNN